MPMITSFKDFILYVKKHNIDIYYVGGYVRDYLLKIETYDYDFATSVKPNNLLTTFKDFDVVQFDEALGYLKVKLDDKIIEITSFRKEIGVKDVRYPKEISFDATILDDALRRDFTVNAIYMTLDHEIIDPLNGVNDLKKQIIKVIKDPDKRFKEDPVRIMRALRFSLKLGFEIAFETKEAINRLSFLVNNLKTIKYIEMEKLFALSNCLEFMNMHNSLYTSFFNIILYDNFFPLYKRGTTNLYLNFLSLVYNLDISLLNITKEQRHNLDLLKDLNNYHKLKAKDIVRYYDNYEELIKCSLNENKYQLLDEINYLKTNHKVIFKSDLQTKYQTLLAQLKDEKMTNYIYNNLYEIMYQKDHLENLNEIDVLNNLIEEYYKTWE